MNPDIDLNKLGTGSYQEFIGNVIYADLNGMLLVYGRVQRYKGNKNRIMSSLC